jgi:hypothetical protein
MEGRDEERAASSGQAERIERPGRNRETAVGRELRDDIKRALRGQTGADRTSEVHTWFCAPMMRAPPSIFAFIFSSVPSVLCRFTT